MAKAGKTPNLITKSPNNTIQVNYLAWILSDFTTVLRFVLLIYSLQLCLSVLTVPRGAVTARQFARFHRRGKLIKATFPSERGEFVPLRSQLSCLLDRLSALRLVDLFSAAPAGQTRS